MQLPPALHRGCEESFKTLGKAWELIVKLEEASRRLIALPVLKSKTGEQA
jgi:hypothetical protein